VSPGYRDLTVRQRENPQRDSSFPQPSPLTAALSPLYFAASWRLLPGASNWWGHRFICSTRSIPKHGIS
jgi:hypothetical protein